MSHASYAHTVSDPTDLLKTLQEQMAAVKTAVQAAFGGNMDECVAHLEAQDAKARASDPDAPLQHRITAAKTLVSAAYVYLDAIWMCLKTKGVDPTTHPVHAELERVHSYFAKVKRATGDDESRPRIDADASRRMVQAAAHVGTHTRFDEAGAESEQPKMRRHKNKPKP